MNCDYQGFEIESFEVGRGLWHARFRRADHEPVIIDGVLLPALNVGFAWPDPETAKKFKLIIWARLSVGLRVSLGLFDGKSQHPISRGEIRWYPPGAVLPTSAVFYSSREPARRSPPLRPSATAAGVLFRHPGATPAPSSISPVAILPTMTVAPITSAGRRSPFGPLGIGTRLTVDLADTGTNCRFAKAA
jgi:hypothetical protein